MLRILSLVVVAFALIPAAALWMGLKIPLRLECAYLILMSALIILLIFLWILWGNVRERKERERKVSWQIRIALGIASVCIICIIGLQNVFRLSSIIGLQSVFWLSTFSANLPVNLNLCALILLIISVLSQIPPNEDTAPIPSQKEKEEKEELNLALYTFYEGRVQTTKSILVGILTGILSLQIPIYLAVTIKKQSYSSLKDPIVLLFILSLPMFASMKSHMCENNDKSKKFQSCLPKPLKYYNPKLSNWIYTVRGVFPLALEWIFLGAIFGLAIQSIIFHN